MSLEDIASNILETIISLEPPLNLFYNNFWSKLPEWGFILIATIIGVIVALKIDRKFRDKERLHGWKLVKETSIETFGVSFSLFILVLVIGAGIFIVIEAIKWGKSISSFWTLAAIITAYFIYRYRKKEKNRQLVERLQKGKAKKKLSK